MSKTSIHKRTAEWEARAEQLGAQLERAWASSEHAVESLWHQSAVAALHWVSGHRGRVTAFRNSVKGTPAEGVVNSALRAIRVEGKARAPRRRAVGRAGR